MNKLISLSLIALATLVGQVHAEDSEATRRLKERSKQLEPLITKVSPSVYCASGFSPANISMIVGDDGVVIVDTGMFAAHAEAVLKEFRTISELPVKAIILTHGHGDQTGGASVFIEGAKLHPDDQAIRPMKADALELLAAELITATGRNYCLTVAQELRKPATK